MSVEGIFRQEFLGTFLTREKLGLKCRRGARVRLARGKGYVGECGDGRNGSSIWDSRIVLCWNLIDFLIGVQSDDHILSIELSLVHRTNWRGGYDMSHLPLKLHLLLLLLLLVFGETDSFVAKQLILPGVGIIALAAGKLLPQGQVYVLMPNQIGFIGKRSTKNQNFKTSHILYQRTYLGHTLQICGL